MSCHKNAKFLARTVFVHKNNVEQAHNALMRFMRNDGIVDQVRRKKYYEKPTTMRRRISYERCKRIYNADMQRKIEFVMKVNRESPWIG
ncbi:small subunit ribosomal protein S21 [Mytilus galloprovincialis]|uniref:Small subunit ribosomal protein S21 n=1 Tax=Mytilus galloprovincialis TaxID=29158 RepID=A0A8B6BK98_MYTGA|nr:small subunit ribosomal protein S21 [Mytilus galloprovincialis]